MCYTHYIAKSFGYERTTGEKKEEKNVLSSNLDTIFYMNE